MQEINDWLKKKADKYTCGEIQNEILKIMGHQILRAVIENVQKARYFTIMVDECVDSSNKEQLVICFRYVDDELEVHEDFVGFYHIPNVTADIIVAAIKDTLLRFNLNIARCRGQCYDGASNMSGSRNGVKTQILQLEGKALYTHCYGHVLSLAVSDTIKGIASLRSCMDTTHELIQCSSKRANLFKEIKVNMCDETSGFRILCPTRWTVCNETFRSILENYLALLELWDTIFYERVDSELRARVNGVCSQMNTFDYFFGVHLIHIILRHTDNLSKTLQHTKLSAAEGQDLAKSTVTTLQVGS